MIKKTLDIKKKIGKYLKKKEKKRLSVLDGVPQSLPQLIRSSRIQEKAVVAGFDWENKNQVLLKVDEEVLELKDAILKNEGINDEIGDVLFTIVNLSRHLGYDAESSLKNQQKNFQKDLKKLKKI